jgi:hypothetical protein
MKPFARLIVMVALVLALQASRMAAKTASDLVSPEKRRAAVELAQRLTRVPDPGSVPADLVNPFNPAGFDQPDPEELRAAAAAYAKGQTQGPAPQGGAPGVAGAGGAAPGAAAGPGPAPRPPGEREILESLAAKLPTTGTFIFNGEPLLVLGRGRVKVGDKFTVAYNGQDYELELTAIDRTTFTLRYHGEEITRSIKLGKSP